MTNQNLTGYTCACVNHFPIDVIPRLFKKKIYIYIENRVLHLTSFYIVERDVSLITY